MSYAGIGLLSEQDRCPVVSKALLHITLTLIKLIPPSHLELQDSKHQQLEAPLTHVTQFQHGLNISWDPTGSPYTCIISSAGQIPHIIGCNTHSGWRALACACIRHAKLLPLEVRRPSGKGPDQKQHFIWLPSETINNLSSSSADMDAFDGCFSGKIKAFSTCKCWHTFDSHARLLDK